MASLINTHRSPPRFPHVATPPPSQLVAVLFSIGGSVLVCFPLLESMDQFPLRSLWAIAAAFLVSTYVVYFQRQAENEDRLNIPLFLGFVGLFSMMLMWPGFFIARVSLRAKNDMVGPWYLFAWFVFY